MSELLRLAAGYSDVHRRLWGAPPLRRPLVLRPPAVVILPGSAPIDLCSSPSWLTITLLVALKYGVTLDDLTSVKRFQRVAVPRQEAMYLLHTHTAMSLQAIGRRFNRNHATVLHSIRTVNARRAGGKCDA